MSEQQATILTPSDSVSNSGSKKRVRPGKAQRAAMRQSVPTTQSTVTGTTSMSNASYFANRAASAPVPQPGKFPVVFPSGAGEPTRDVEFAFDGDTISETLRDLPGNFINSARFAEFSSDAGYTDDSFAKDVARFSLLAIAQQVVHAHVNMLLPMGDFSAVSSTDHYMMSSIRSIVQQFGEFSVDPLGTRYLLSNYETTVKSLVNAADKISAPGVERKTIPFYIRTMWLPQEKGDSRTTFIVAHAVSKYLQRYGVNVSIEELRAKLFNEPSDAFNALKVLLPVGDRDKFDGLFSGYDTPAAFAAKFAANNRFLVTELNLYWGGTPHASSMNWDLVPKVVFPRLILDWAKKRNTITRFFMCGSGLAEKTNASGSAAQLSSVSDASGVTVVRSRVALSAPEFSLLACFPASALVADGSEYNVVLTTSIPIKVKATEFIQLDWLG